MHQNNIPQDKIAVFPNLLDFFFYIKSMFENQQQLQLTWFDKKSFKTACISSLDQKISHKTLALLSSFPQIVTLFGGGTSFSSQKKNPWPAQSKGR